MAKKILKENQRFHYLEVYVLLGVFSSILIFEVVQSTIIEHSKDLSHWSIFGILVIGFIVAWWLVLSARLRIRVSKSALTIQRTPFFGKRHKLLFKDIQALSFISISQAARTSGWTINMDTDCREFAFGDTNGIQVLMKNGKEFTIFSDLLYNRRHQLEKIMELQSKR